MVNEAAAPAGPFNLCKLRMPNAGRGRFSSTDLPLAWYTSDAESDVKPAAEKSACAGARAMPVEREFTDQIAGLLLREQQTEAHMTMVDRVRASSMRSTIS
jgi:hypothetical protein